jgi:hypothetical protein
MSLREYFLIYILFRGAKANIPQNIAMKKLKKQAYSPLYARMMDITTFKKQQIIKNLPL